MVIGLSLDDGESPVQLLCKDGAHHLVREGHLGKGNLSARPLVNGLREAVGPSHGENKVLGARSQLFFHVFGKFQRAELAAVLIQ